MQHRTGCGGHIVLTGHPGSDTKHDHGNLAYSNFFAIFNEID